MLEINILFSFIGIKNRLQAIGDSNSLKGGEGKYSIVQSEINFLVLQHVTLQPPAVTEQLMWPDITADMLMLKQKPGTAD